MRKSKIETSKIVGNIEDNLIVTWESLCKDIGTTRQTIISKLKEYKRIVSINKNSKFFTLDQVVPEFDKDGLWKHNDLIFSKHGDAQSTLKYLVENSEMGYTASELEEKLSMNTRQHLYKLAHGGDVFRMKRGYEYIFFSNKPSVRNKQVKARENTEIKTLIEEPEPFAKASLLEDTQKIQKILDDIASKASAEEVTATLKNMGVSSIEDVVRKISIEYDTLKKTIRLYLRY